MAGTRTTPSTSSDTSSKKESEGEGGIEYVDMGDYTLEIDRRLPLEQRRRIPKAQRSVAVDEKTRKELEERVKVQNEVAKQEREEAEKPLEVPPAVEERDPNEPPPSVTVTAEGSSDTGTESKS